MPATIFSDIITTSALPDSLRLIYSNELEFTSRPTLVYDQPAFVEERPDFAAKRGQQVTWTIYHQLPATIAPLSETQDVTGGSVTDHQVSFRVQEYGNAMGVSEALDLFSYHGPISNIVKTLLAPNEALTRDTITRNTFWYAPNRQLTDSSLVGAAYHSYVGGTSRSTLNPATSILSADVARRAALDLTIRRVPTMGGQQPSYLCITHPATIYDLRSDPFWKDAQLYAGATRIFNGEVGMIHGVRFITSDRARIANGGAIKVVSTHVGQSQLQTAYPVGVNQVTVADAGAYAQGDEVTLHAVGVSTTVGANTWLAPDGQDASAEEMVIKSITGNVITFTNKTMIAHSVSDYCTEGLDVYPMVMHGGLAAMGKGTVVPPEVRVSLPTDKLRRTSYVGWYGLYGMGIVRDWAYSVVETLASVNVAPPFGY